MPFEWALYSANRKVMAKFAGNLEDWIKRRFKDPDEQNSKNLKIENLVKIILIDCEKIVRRERPF